MERGIAEEREVSRHVNPPTRPCKSSGTGIAPAAANLSAWNHRQLEGN